MLSQIILSIIIILMVIVLLIKIISEDRMIEFGLFISIIIFVAGLTNDFYPELLNEVIFSTIIILVGIRTIIALKYAEDRESSKRTMSTFMFFFTLIAIILYLINDIDLK